MRTLRVRSRRRLVELGGKRVNDIAPHSLRACETLVERVFNVLEILLFWHVENVPPETDSRVRCTTSIGLGEFLKDNYTSRGDACDIWTAATGVAAFQNARIPPRVLNHQSLADTSRFEKRWFRPPHSKMSQRPLLAVYLPKRTHRRDAERIPSNESNVRRWRLPLPS